jgi:hypothetical protein
MAQASPNHACHAHEREDKQYGEEEHGSRIRHGQEYAQGDNNQSVGA